MPKSKGKIDIDSERCKGCGLCIWACPKGQIILSEKDDARGIRVACFDENSQDCTGCTFCGIICPEVAIEIYKTSSK
jgi:2-oxoglutarate ferredoxin oxidoreductase subunit delta